MAVLSLREDEYFARHGAAVGIDLVRYYPLSIFLKKRSCRQIQNNAGFFPVSMKSLRDFYNVYKESVKEMDLLVRWRVEELLYQTGMHGSEGGRLTN